jgi:phage terminase small subunit
MALNAKHILFINDYMISQNVTTSYQKVYGCTEEAARKNGSRLMTNDDIRSEIERRQKAINEQVEENTGISVQWVLDSFKSIAERCMQAESITDREGNPTGEWRFDSSGANKAVESIGKYLGMFKDKGDAPVLTNTVNVSGLSLEELRNLAKSKPIPT